MDKTLLLVDDDPAVLEVLRKSLRSQYRLRIANSGHKGLELARLEPRPDLILLDIELPDMHGYEVCSTLKSDALTAEIPVIFLSSHDNVDDITYGLGLGAVDYVTKPVAPPILQARVRTHLRLQESKALLQDQNAHLESLVAKRTSDLESRTNELQARTLDLQSSYDLTIAALGCIAETRDNETGNHIHRTRDYVKRLVGHLSAHPDYRDVYSAAQWELIWKSAPLHDIGKVGIPDHILLKPGKLSNEEFSIMKRHTVLGWDAIRTAERRLKNIAHGEERRVQNGYSFLRFTLEITLSHHERWDGTGYPEGLSGESIPLPARLMAIADVYDALISKRVYKTAFSHEEAIKIICAERGRHFDPRIADFFLELADDFKNIAEKFQDSDTEPQGESCA